MSTKNAIIRISINIDDRAVRDLNDVISNLNNSISRLVGSIGDIENALTTLSSSNGPVVASSDSFNLLTLSMLALNLDSEILGQNISSLSKIIFLILSKEVSDAKGGIGYLLMRPSNQSFSASKIKTCIKTYFIPIKITAKNLKNLSKCTTTKYYAV